MSERVFEQLVALLSDEMAAVNDLIQTSMASKHAPRIPEVTAHLVNAGGKRLRPLLTLATANLSNYEGPYATHLAAIVEFIHTATLLHDDVVDESDERRGHPTANLLWDNSSSVLVGDYLFSRSFQLMVKTGSLRVLEILANASATIAEGEVLQLTAQTDLKTDEDVYMTIIKGKTSALFAAACQVGGVIADIEHEKEEALRIYGDELGIAFQIIDDYLDYAGESKKLGKNIGDDFRDRKLTLPVIKALSLASDEDKTFWLRTMGKGQQDEGDLEKALEILTRTGALEATKQAALTHANNASKALEVFEDTEMRDVLIKLPEFVVSRAV